MEGHRAQSGHWHLASGGDSGMSDGEHAALQAYLSVLRDAAKLGKTCACFACMYHNAK